jgi:hypothetical protein
LNFPCHGAANRASVLQRLLWIALIAAFCSRPGTAQSSDPFEITVPAVQPQAEQSPTGNINGTVLDETGAVVVGAQVALTQEGSSQPQARISGERGQFSFANVQPGNYQITIAASGFAKQTATVTLHPGEFYIVPEIALPLATQATEIEVRASPSQIEVAEAQIKIQEQQRILAVVPNFYVSYIPNPAPLRPRQKMELAWKTTLDPVTFGLAGIVAGVEHAQNAFPAYGQGTTGYLKRFGAAYADSTTSTFIGSAILPSLLHQDPRYIYKGMGSKKSRFFYAIANSVVCKGDNGHWEPNYSGILGGLAAGGISNLYYPPQDRGAALVFENTAIGTGTTAVINVLQEFVVRKLTPHQP